MFDKLEAILKRYTDIEESLQDQTVINDYKKYAELNKELKNIESVVVLYKQYKQLSADLQNYKMSLDIEKEEDIRQFLKDEIKDIEDHLLQLVDKMKLELDKLGIPFYDPMMIIEKTEGRMADDDFWLKIEV